MITLLAVNIWNNEVKRSTSSHQVGNLLTTKHLIHSTNKCQTHRTELQTICSLITT